MREQLPDGDAAFAGQREFGPVVSHREVELEQAAAMSNGHGRGGHAFGYGECQAERVLLPGIAGRSFASPQIDNLVTVVINGAGRASLAALREISLELAANRCKLWIAITLDEHKRLAQLMTIKRSVGQETP